MHGTKQHAPYGTLDRLDNGQWQLRFTPALPHPPERVWRAITDPQHGPVAVRPRAPVAGRADSRVGRGGWSGMYKVPKRTGRGGFWRPCMA